MTVASGFAACGCGFTRSPRRSALPYASPAPWSISRRLQLRAGVNVPAAIFSRSVVRWPGMAAKVSPLANGRLVRKLGETRSAGRGRDE